ncbi:hypothetical protein F5Y11DRAFT_91863 [Daldinia sp. FL1419]|nr:hypothetical protein F5Y11DRAFT_91863 [Daldinia sp. FL1419]
MSPSTTSSMLFSLGCFCFFLYKFFFLTPVPLHATTGPFLQPSSLPSIYPFRLMRGAHTSHLPSPHSSARPQSLLSPITDPCMICSFLRQLDLAFQRPASLFTTSTLYTTARFGIVVSACTNYWSTGQHKNIKFRIKYSCTFVGNMKRSTSNLWRSTRII